MYVCGCAWICVSHTFCLAREEEKVTRVLCLLTECTMLEGGRAVIWLLVSALRAARHPKDSRTNPVAPVFEPTSCRVLHRNPMTPLTHGPPRE